MTHFKACLKQFLVLVPAILLFNIIGFGASVLLVFLACHAAYWLAIVLLVPGSFALTAGCIILVKKCGGKLMAVPTATALLLMVYLFAGFFLAYRFWYYYSGKIAEQVSVHDLASLGPDYLYYSLRDYRFDQAKIGYFHRVVSRKDSKYYSEYFVCPIISTNDDNRMAVSRLWFGSSYKAGPGNWTRELNLKKFRKAASQHYAYFARYDDPRYFLVAAKSIITGKMPSPILFVYGVVSPHEDVASKRRMLEILIIVLNGIWITTAVIEGVYLIFHPDYLKEQSGGTEEETKRDTVNE